MEWGNDTMTARTYTQSELDSELSALRERCAKVIEDLDCPEHLWEDEAKGWDRGREDSAKALRALPAPQVKP